MTLLDTPEFKKKLDIIYHKYNKRKYVNPDPLQFLYNYSDIKDRELAGLIAALLAYGRVDQIIKTVSKVLLVMGYSPYQYLNTCNDNDIIKDFEDFKYRFTKGIHISNLILGLKEILNKFDSVENCFIKGFSKKDTSMLPALSFFIKQLKVRGDTGNLTADPEKKSACKRNNLFLRWMIRQDEVDPGGWKNFPCSMLIIPLDTHMHHAGKILGLTNRKQADMKTAIEITQGFKKLCPQDPVKYDFCLTRFGIRPDMTTKDLVNIL